MNQLILDRKNFLNRTTIFTNMTFESMVGYTLGRFDLVRKITIRQHPHDTILKVDTFQFEFRCEGKTVGAMLYTNGEAEGCIHCTTAAKFDDLRIIMLHYSDPVIESQFKFDVEVDYLQEVS